MEVKLKRLTFDKKNGISVISLITYAVFFGKIGFHFKQLMKITMKEPFCFYVWAVELLFLKGSLKKHITLLFITNF